MINVVCAKLATDNCLSGNMSSAQREFYDRMNNPVVGNPVVGNLGFTPIERLGYLISYEQ